MLKIKKPRAIILDIEGTTTSSSYYPSAVAPYIRNNTESYLKQHWNEEHVQAIVNDLRQQALLSPDMPKILDQTGGTNVGRENSNSLSNSQKQLNLAASQQRKVTLGEIQKSTLNHIEFLYRTNTTTIALLYFQMYVWLDGQMKGVLKTHIFKDVAEMLYRWKFEEKIQIYIYSAARADVQMLMFACTEFGSLLHLIDGHFDSKIGSKTNPETYNKISQAISIPPQSIMFFTDDPKEAKSAKSSNYKVMLVKREKKIFSPIEEAQFDTLSSFDKIKFID